MATAADIVTRAYLLIGVGQGGEALASDLLDDGLTALNEMLHAWALDGIDLGHTDLEATDDILLPDSHLKAVRYNLAIDLAPENEQGVPSALVLATATETKGQLKAAYLDIDDLGMDTGLKRLPSQFWGSGRVR